MAYVPPHKRQREVQLIRDPTLITSNVLGADIFAGIDGPTSYTYCTWLTLHSREEDRYCSLIHRGDGEFIRFPGIWLHSDSNQLHVRVGKSKRDNAGIAYSCSDIPVEQNVHIAVVANSDTGELMLYLNGHLDYKKRNMQFSTGEGPCFLGKDPWHGSSVCTFTDTCAFNYALSEDQIRGVITRLDGLTELPAALPQFELEDQDPIERTKRAL